MICPKCKGRIFTTDTVNNNSENETYREKKCGDCGAVFYTVEFEAVDNDRFKKVWKNNHR